MKDTMCLVRMQARRNLHAVQEFLRGSRLRVAVVGLLVLGLWLLMFAMFYGGFRFMHRTMESAADKLVEHMFAFLFLMLLALMTISNAIISYVSLFRSEETAFLYSLPIRPGTTFGFRGSGSVVFSIWGMCTLVVPMILSYGMTFPVPWHFYLFAALLSTLFIALTTELGAFLALLVAIALPRRRKTALLLLGFGAALILVMCALPVWSTISSARATQSGLGKILNRIAFSQHWALPSQWVSSGMLAAGAGDPRGAGLLCLHMLANVLFLPLVSHRLAFYAYRRTWQSIQSSGSTRRYCGGLIDRLLYLLVSFLPRRPRQLVLKDMKTFLRDPAQWSQFVVFFGILAVYIFNLRTGGWTDREGRWHSLITGVNLGAICLTLATLTSRFVYPQLSLEGRRIWITGLLPIDRRMIIWGKFFFSTVGTFAVSVTLMVLSDLMLGLDLWVMGVHVVVVLCVCCGLNGLAVGLGALYPQMDSDNPAKIVSSFGGTLNLILSIVFITLAVATCVIPLHFYMLGKLAGLRLVAHVSGGLALLAAASLVACLLPMAAGARAFTRMEF